jgi:hypothetical protein
MPGFHFTPELYCIPLNSCLVLCFCFNTFNKWILLIVTGEKSHVLLSFFSIGNLSPKISGLCQDFLFLLNVPRCMCIFLLFITFSVFTKRTRYGICHYFWKMNTQYCLKFFFYTFPFFLHLAFLLYTNFTIYDFSAVFEHYVPCSIPFSLCICIWQIFIHKSSSFLSFYLVMSNWLMSQWKASFISLTVFLICGIDFYFSLRAAFVCCHCGFLSHCLYFFLLEPLVH